MPKPSEKLNFPVSNFKALKLDTGKFNFSDGFGIFHGPATVSDVFSADEGDFLKFDYSAQGEDDDYHVAGYIYEVNPDGSAKSAPIMAIIGADFALPSGFTS